jgi:hypothetical protein
MPAGSPSAAAADASSGPAGSVGRRREGSLGRASRRPARRRSSSDQRRSARERRPVVEAVVKSQAAAAQRWAQTWLWAPRRMELARGREEGSWRWSHLSLGRRPEGPAHGPEMLSMSAIGKISNSSSASKVALQSEYRMADVSECVLSPGG